MSRTTHFFAFAIVLVPYSLSAEEMKITNFLADSPFKQDSSKGVAYINDEGSFLLVGKRGTATYVFDGKAYFASLKYVGTGTVNPGKDTCLIYKDIDTPFTILFSKTPRVPRGYDSPRTWLYWSKDGVKVNRWFTANGTRKYDVPKSSVDAFAGTKPGSSNPLDRSQFPITTKWVEKKKGGTRTKVQAKLSARPNDGLIEIWVSTRKSGTMGTGYGTAYVNIMDQYGNVLWQVPEPLNKQTGADQISGTSEGPPRYEKYSVPLDVLRLGKQIGLAVEVDETTGVWRTFGEFVETIKQLQEAARAAKELGKEGLEIYAMFSTGGGV